MLGTRRLSAPTNGSNREIGVASDEFAARIRKPRPSAPCRICISAKAVTTGIRSRHLMKSCHSLFLNVAWRLCAAAILCVTAGVSAQSVHREVDVGGNVTFTDRPEMTPSPRGSTASGSDLVGALAENRPMTSQSAAMIDFNEANRRLVRAQQGRLEHPPSDKADDNSVRIMNERFLRGPRESEREIVAAQRRSTQTSLVRGALAKSADATVTPKPPQP